ncbi:MAG: methylmalonyl Co-A mutase-associated GTPase MeaB [Bacteroidota bacterium]
MNNSRLTSHQYAEGVLSGDRVLLAKAITLIESTLPADQTVASELLDNVISKVGNSVRIGITGVPGVGKSTFIESFGKYITSQGKKIAILTIDPSSQLTRGSILGDKTRMEELSKDPLAFIRPTASGNALGGVANKTRETMLLCEAAGFEVIIIETVGVGQSEVAVKNMVDFFLLLMLAGAGDELQGIKKGIMEMADGIVITKADGDNIRHATEAQAEYQQALHLFPTPTSGWKPKVLTSSAINNKGIEEIWKMILKFHDITSRSGFFESNRQQQSLAWFNDRFEQLLKNDYLRFSALQKKVVTLKGKVEDHKISPHKAAELLLEAYHDVIKKGVGH